MPGLFAPNYHEGGRSETLADYVFSRWGTVTPVRGRDDHGVDLYCALSDRVGSAAAVRDYFSVQVKSTLDPWTFQSPESVKWLVEYPTPLLLAVVDKKKGNIRVYHVMPRFYLWALGTLPDSLELTPEDTDEGSFVEWTSGKAFSLSAPIIRVALADLLDDEKLSTLRSVLEYWVRFDRENCDLLRYGLLRFRMPMSYRVNEIPRSGGIGEVGLSLPENPELLNRGIVSLAEGAECIGGQLDRLGDRAGALRAALLVRHLQMRYDKAFANLPRWSGSSMPGDLGTKVVQRLNSIAEQMGPGPTYYYRGIDEVGKALEDIPLVKQFVGKA
jgi:hypothetical protein